MELWEKYTQKCQELLNNEDIRDKNISFLESVMVWINDNQHVTEKQIKVIKNIEYNLSDNADWRHYLDYCDEIINHHKCSDIGYDTASGIQSFIEENHYITDNQKKAIDNCKAYLENID